MSNFDVAVTISILLLIYIASQCHQRKYQKTAGALFALAFLCAVSFVLSE